MLEKFSSDTPNQETFDSSRNAIREKFKTDLQGKNFATTDEARVALADLKIMVNKHNQNFPSQHRTLVETMLEEIQISLDGKPFTAQLIQMGDTTELHITFSGVSGQSPDANTISKIWE